MEKKKAYITNFFMADGLGSVEGIYESEEKKALGERLFEIEYGKEIAVSFTAKGFNETIKAKRSTQIVFVLNLTGDTLTEQQRKGSGAYEVISGIACTKAFKITKIVFGENEERTICERIKADQLVGYWAAVVLDFSNVLAQTVLDFVNKGISFTNDYKEMVMDNLAKTGRHTAFSFFHNAIHGVEEAAELLHKLTQTALNLMHSKQRNELIEPYLQKEREKALKEQEKQSPTFEILEVDKNISLEFFSVHKDMDLGLPHLTMAERFHSEKECIEFNYQLAIDRALDERDFEALKEILSMKAEGSKC